jgi:amino-acid N-acetyltransferase
MLSTVELRAAEHADREFIETVLRDNDLPTGDISGKMECLYICEADGERIGVGGFERYGETGLLRSVVIDESVRGQGYGTEVCDMLLDRARDVGVSELYLLTTTAPEFFPQFGFDEIDRESAPDAIQETTEFAQLCPDSAVCLKCELDTPTTDKEPVN